MNSESNTKIREAAMLVPMPDVLATLKNEIRILSDGINDLQELIGNLVGAGAFDGTQSVYELQSLDRMSQSLDAISDYLGSASNLSSPEWKIDVAEAARSIKLADLSDRLKGLKQEAPLGTDAGDFDDFALVG